MKKKQNIGLNNALNKYFLAHKLILEQMFEMLHVIGLLMVWAAMVVHKARLNFEVGEFKKETLIDLKVNSIIGWNHAV